MREPTDWTKHALAECVKTLTRDRKVSGEARFVADICPFCEREFLVVAVHNPAKSVGAHEAPTCEVWKLNTLAEYVRRVNVEKAKPSQRN